MFDVLPGKKSKQISNQRIKLMCNFYTSFPNMSYILNKPNAPINEESDYICEEDNYLGMSMKTTD